MTLSESDARLSTFSSLSFFSLLSFSFILFLISSFPYYLQLVYMPVSVYDPDFGFISSTRYVAPEYAMTGHLLVKSDVYSYGVVLLELLTGRKPVDMSQPPGQENLVSWARPLLTTEESLESIVDPSLGPNFPIDSISKVAAIASMCVQPEVSHRPFMGEVVQALKLVCNECEETREFGSRSYSREDLSMDMDAKISNTSGLLQDPLQGQSPVSNYDSELDVERGYSASDLLGPYARQDTSGSPRRHSSSGPLRIGKKRRLWQKMRRFSGGSLSEHGLIYSTWH